jgi:hypothetical protein
MSGPSPLTHLQHLELAEDFYQAFRDLPKDSPAGLPISWPRYFMLCHSIELALRAFLLAQGANEAQLRALGTRHNIVILLNKAQKQGLGLGPLAASELILLSEAHAKFWPRYPRQDATPVFLIEPFEPYVVELLKAVAKAIRGSFPLHVKY